MEWIVEQLDLVIIFVGATFGSIKASLEMHENKHCVARFFDILLGIFVGTMSAYHFGSEWSVWFNGLISLVGGVCGAMVINVGLQLLPSVIRTTMKKLAEKVVDKLS